MPRKRLSVIDEIEQSKWFDADWYMTQYPDVAVSGLSAAHHYVLLGESWGRQAGPRFDAQFYLERHPDVAKSGASPLLHFIRHGEKEGRLPVQLQALLFEKLLWQQENVEKQIASLEALLKHQNSWEASYAAWALARWYALKGAWERCADVLASRHLFVEVKPSTPAPMLLEVEALINSGQLVAAWQRIEKLKEAYPDYQDTALAMANLLAAQLAACDPEPHPALSSQASQAAALQDQLRLKKINTLYRANNLYPLALKDPTKPLAIDNLGTGSVVDRPAGLHFSPSQSSPKQAELISIIVPVFNAEEYLATALRSLAEQTYQHIEVIVVDDASTDGSLAVATRFSEQDKRFRVIVQPYNQGAYAARNRGLEVAKGAFITVHDSDDWSHPQKLALQAAGLQDNPEWKACFSDWVRCSTKLLFSHWRVEEQDGWIHCNMSSFMFRQDVFETLGFCDVVKVAADTEYYRRFIKAYGARACGDIQKGVPLSFGRSLPASLSQAGPTHLITLFRGLRCDYHNAAAQWHARAETPSDLYMPAHPDTRPFDAPVDNLSG